MTERPTPPSARRWLALPVILAGTFMTILDFFIVNVTVPSVQSDLRASGAQIQLVIAGYGITYAAGLITGGRLGDLYGRRKVFAVGLLAFTLASAACGMSQSADMLVISRMVQGLAAALMFPQVLSIINVTYTGEDRGRAFMGFGMAIGLASVSGQVIGGLLIQGDVFGLGWRNCFLVNVPIGVLMLVCTPGMVPESRSQQARRLDLVGFSIVTPALILLLLPLIQGRQSGWPLWCWVSLALSGGLLTVFVRHQTRLSGRGGTPLVEPRLFGTRVFTTGLLTVFTVYAGMASFFLVLALYLQDGLRYSPIKSGLVVLPCGLGFFLLSLAAPKIVRRFAHRTLALGSLVLVVGEVALILLAHHSHAHPDVTLLCVTMFVIGVGMGAMGPPLLSQVLLGVPGEHTGSASGVLSTTQQMAGALGVAVIGIIFYGVLGSAASTSDYVNALVASLGYTVLLGAVTAVITTPRRWWVHHSSEA
ncbi:MFS transporter [Streptomyces beihaiensis]|uniref:MFS transporter n=1 Tax=Streptomyces beihaiensis TaxID=2984495 RepID=A0ABT3TVR9_9ACTN|nr:MFS transporter [Streptomyces beihaiensis]MCX3060160.1 MFS transporter [Streptomyces beihaiensis]